MANRRSWLEAPLLIALIFLYYSGRVRSGSTGQCGQPEVPENGHVVFHSSGPLVAGAAVSYKCDVGFILVGPEQRVCEANSAWSEHAPVCAINVALYKPAIQSSTLYVDSIVHHANYSTDGNFDGVCSSTKPLDLLEQQQQSDANKNVDDRGNWWRVDLLEAYRVYAVEFLIPPSGAESAPGEMSQIEIYGSMAGGNDGGSIDEGYAVCYKHKGRLETNQLHTFVCQKELTARYIKIVSRMPAALQLCEVVVLSTSATSDWQCGSISNMDSWGAFDGRCFYGSTEPMPWFSASTHCQMNGAGLVTDVHEPLHHFLSAQAKHRTSKNAQHYWLGLVMSGSRDWTWINGKPTKAEFWANPKSRDVSVSNVAYAVAMAQPVGWSWVPALQTLWYNWICQSKPRFCSGPGIPQNGGVMLSTQMYTIGASSYYYCNYGYVLRGAESRACLENGTWSGRVPKCVVVDCAKPETPAGISLKYLNESTLAGSKLEYRCSAGQKIVGNAVRTCQPDGTWSDVAPKCNDVDCGQPPEVTNGRVYLSENSTKVGSVAEWMCDVGYGLIGAPVRHCSSNGQWMPAQLPYCYDVNSVHAPMPQGNGESWHHSSLMTGFVVAVVVLLLVIIVVLVWTWRKKKAYDGLSMSTLYAAASSQFAAAAAASSNCSTGHPEVLYAFPTASIVNGGYQRTHSPNADGVSNYYVPSSLNTSSHDSHSLKSSSAAAAVAGALCKTDRKPSFLSADDLGMNPPPASSQMQPPFFLATPTNMRMPVVPPPFFITPLGPAAQGIAGVDNPIFLAPFGQDPRQMERLMNDIHLTLPARRRGGAVAASGPHKARRSPRPASFYHTIRQHPPDTPSSEASSSAGRSAVRTGAAKTMGAAAGRKFNTVLAKVRRKLSEANFNLISSTNSASSNPQSESGESRVTPLERTAAGDLGHYPTLRISLADIVQQMSDANTNRSKTAQLVPDRSNSPTASELFGFDDDDDEDADRGTSYASSPRAPATPYMPRTVRRQVSHDQNELEETIRRGLPHSDNAQNQRRRDSGGVEAEDDDESKIYDLPPDASALLYGNLAKALLKQSQVANENIYETPEDAEAAAAAVAASSSSSSTSIESRSDKALEEAGIEIVQSYC